MVFDYTGELITMPRGRNQTEEPVETAEAVEQDVSVENSVKRRTTKIHVDGDCRPPKAFRSNFEAVGFKPGTKVVFDVEEINADENWIVIKISKAAAE
jgi:hypothetical protein